MDVNKSNIALLSFGINACRLGVLKFLAKKTGIKVLTFWVKDILVKPGEVVVGSLLSPMGIVM